MTRDKKLLVSFVFICLGVVCSNAMAAEQVLDESKQISLWSTLSSGGVVGVLILIVSIIMIAFVVDGFLQVRRVNILPDDLIHKVKQHMNSKEVGVATRLCKENKSFIATVVHAGLSQSNGMFGYYDMQTSMEEASQRWISRLYRRLDYLAFIGAVSPMLGLLGTVTGMIGSFNQIAITEGTARPSQLAGGISEALVTTCLGLVVAIPAMFFVTFLRNKLDSFVAEAEPVVDKLMASFKSGENK